MKDKNEFRGRNELGNFANVPVFIGNFYVITDFIVVENMDPYLDEGMGEVVVREPFCEVSCMENRRFDGIITIHDEDDSVTYQMVRSNLRFKHYTNEQCHKIPPLLKDLARKKSTTLVKYRSSRILLIMEYFVKISKKARILELKRKHLKNIVLTSNMPYPSRKIRRICACTSQETTKNQSPIRQYEFDIEFELVNGTKRCQVKHDMDDNVHDEIHGVMYDTHSDASIAGKKGDLEFVLLKMKANPEKANNGWSNAATQVRIKVKSKECLLCEVNYDSICGSDLLCVCYELGPDGLYFVVVFMVRSRSVVTMEMELDIENMMLEEYLRIGAENLKRIEQEEIPNGCDDEKAGVCEQVVDNINVNTTREKEEVYVEDIMIDEDHDGDNSNTKEVLQWSLG
ncbi:hypothetical protein Tco_0839580 [Tanacetum coccineum]|uniref:Uncharacterized protein n=1 Tax=Tanacetum coccineum TaxID=301880 RepID=A0ABQ5AV52_9ASTR